MLYHSSRAQLFANDPFDERGDPNLKPEKSSNANLSIGGSFDAHHLHWELIGFWSMLY